MSNLAMKEALWLAKNPEFKMRPANIREFCGPGYLNERNVRPGIMKALVETFGEDVNPYSISDKRRALLTGAIGIGKSTYAAIALSYMVHWIECLKNPKEFYNLSEDSVIAFMMMSTTEKLAQEVIFQKVKKRILNSKWFQQYAPLAEENKRLQKQMRFKGDIWIVPGSSAETSFEGYDILGGIVDEGDSHQVTEQKDYAEAGYNCVDESTQILSKRGWLYHYELEPGDAVLTLNHKTGLSEWNEVEDVKRQDVADKVMKLWGGSEFSALTTPDHRWPVVHRRSGERLWTTSSDIAHTHAISTCAPCADVPESRKYNDDFVSLVAWAYTEGNLRDGRLSIYQKPGRSGHAMIEKSLTRVFGPAKDSMRSGSTQGDPAWVMRTYKDGRLTEFALNKAATSFIAERMDEKVPSNEFIMELTQAQLELFLEVSLIADNCGDNKFAQKNHAAAEAFAFAAILSGKTVSIRQKWQPTASGGYDMLLSRILKKEKFLPKQRACHPTSVFKMIDQKYTGVIWCPQTANKSWFARRNGSVYFTGNTIESRIESRFTDFNTGEHRGLIICIGQAKRKGGFMMRHYDEFSKDPVSVAVRMTIWESFGWYNYTKDKNDIKIGKETAERDSFYYDMRKRTLMSKEAAALVMNKNLIEVPMHYRKSFERDPVKALRDLAGIPPEIEDAFISRPDYILDNQELWHERFPNFENPVGPQSSLDRIILPDWFSAPAYGPDYRRVIHLDTAYSPEGDALGFAMAHVPEKVMQHEEERPIIVFDMLMRLKATPSSEINFGELRKFIYMLRDDLGFNIDLVTLDGFNSFDFIQQLRRNKIKSDYLSVDKTKAPYEDVREAINDKRCLMPKYMVHYNLSDTDTVNIVYKELSEIQDVGKKIDHPKDGSKDVADAITGCVHQLVSATKYLREARTVEREESTTVAKREVVSDANELFGTPEMRSSMEQNSPISFEDFKKSQNDFLTGAVNFDDLLNGNGMPGFNPNSNRVW